MGLTRSSSGLLLRDDFGSDTLANWTEAGGRTGDWSITGGTLLKSNTGDTTRRRTDITTAKCATMRVKEADVTSAYTKLYVGGAGANTSDWPYACQGYCVQTYDTAEAMWVDWKDASTNNNLSSEPGDTLYTRVVDTYYLTRIYIDSGYVKVRQGQTVLAGTLSYANNQFTQGHIGVGGYVGTATFDWVEARTSHLITCSVMTDGHYLRVTDGTTAAEAVASGRTATVDAGLVTFPLTSVAIYTATGGGGSKIDEITSATLADMGGGDVFALPPVAPTFSMAQVGSDIVMTWS
jgi:hypothetical protein